ncbi:MAG: sigma-70 family RNA polymerase sigma factor [Candidatus Limnocylindrales bacterium]
MAREVRLQLLRGSRKPPLGSIVTGDAHPESSPDRVWRDRRVEAFTAFDNARLLQSYRLATLVLRNRDEAEDATQEAIARAWSRWSSLRDPSRFDAWFDRILVNVCRNRLRHGRTIRVVELADAIAEPAADTHAGALSRMELAPAFERLTPDQRIVVVLRYWRDLSVDEIAERLAVPAGTVKSRLHYALKSMRKAMAPFEEASR